MHSGWNLWLQGRTRTSWPFVKSSVQTEQARPLSAFAMRSSVKWDVSASAAPGSVVTLPLLVSICSFGPADVGEAGCCCAWAEASGTVRGDAISISLSCVVVGSLDLRASLSPNLTMGMVSNMARAMPFALLCLALPTMFRGPYRSGCRCALMAPTMMMIRNRAVMIPVMLYKMIMATAVVGDFPKIPPPPPPLSWALMVEMPLSKEVCKKLRSSVEEVLSFIE